MSRTWTIPARIFVSPSGVRGCSSMVEPLPSKQITRVRFPSSAPIERHSGYKESWPCWEVSGVAFSLFWDCFRGVEIGRVVLRSGSQPRPIGTSEGYLRGPLGLLRHEASKSRVPRQKV